MRPDERMIFGSPDWQRDQLSKRRANHAKSAQRTVKGKRRRFSARAYDKAMLEAHEAELKAEEAQKALWEHSMDAIALDIPEWQSILTDYHSSHPRAKKIF